MISPAPFLVSWFGAKIAQLVAWALVLLLIAGLLTGLYVGVKTYFTADLAARVKVISGQMQAASDTGHDSIETIDNTMSNTVATEATTRENTDVIIQADGASAVVAPAVRAAGLQSLCTRASYRASHPSCVQQVSPR